MIDSDYIIDRTRFMLNLNENWDGEDAHVIDAGILKSAVDWLKNIDSLATTNSIEIPTPYISPVPDGGVNFYWKNNKYSLLINFQKNGMPNFSGSIPDKSIETSGTFDISDELGFHQFFVYFHESEKV